MTIPEYQTDAELKEAVLRELESASGVATVNIGVAVTDRALTLSGEVKTYPEKVEALRATLRVVGVTAVADEITVRAFATPNDTDIARYAAQSLQRAVDVPVGSVRATVRDQIVRLTGNVAWEFERHAAYRAVALIRGVAGVDNGIEVHHGSIVTDVKSAIISALERNAHIEAANIKVDATADGTVLLTGWAHSWYQREQAGKAAWAVGVADVDNRVRVQPSP